ncbi:MAG: hypothetical protein NT062_11095, partial [Proteobacteria bacterium]|nr:hypothetical protein [Pseudomonadota bacterium]
MAAANPASMSTTPVGRDAQDNEKTRVTLTPRPNTGTMPPPVAKPHTPWQPKLSSALAYHEAPHGHAQAQKHVPIPPMAPPPPVMVAPPPQVMIAPPMGAAPNLPPLPAPVGPAAAHPTLPFATEAVALPAPPKHDPHKWAIYDKLGLGAPKLDSKKLAKWIVSAYRLLGFVILTIIVVVLVGYITTTAFFYVSNSWVVPMAVSP